MTLILKWRNTNSLKSVAFHRNKDDEVSYDSREVGLSMPRKKVDKYRRDGNALRIVVSPTPSKETSGLSE